jgi:ketol-acid reductoisomerase
MAGQYRTPEHMAKMMQLKEDPELKHVFDDIEANGAAAMEKYWSDTGQYSRAHVTPLTVPQSWL